MKQRNRKRFDATFKARVALEAAQEKESLTQLGKHYGVHSVRVGQWQKQLLERAAAFERPSGRDESRREDELLKKIRALTVERDSLARGRQRSPDGQARESAARTRAPVGAQPMRAVVALALGPVLPAGGGERRGATSHALHRRAIFGALLLWQPTDDGGARS